MLHKKQKGLLFVSLAGVLLLRFFLPPVSYGDQLTNAPGSEHRTVVDQIGREVVLPEELNRIVITGYPLPSVYFMVTGTVDGIVGIHPGARSAAEHSMLGIMAPDLLEAATGFVKAEELNFEEMMKLRPDLVIFWGGYPQQVAQYEASGIPAVAVRTAGGGNPIVTLNIWVNMLGEIFGRQDRAEQIIAHNHQTLGMVTSRLWEVPRDERPRTLILFRHGENEMITPGPYGRFWIEATGGVDVTEGIPEMSSVNMEQIYAWNPEVIFLTNFTPTEPDDIINNRIVGQDWSEIQAVKDGRVYKHPLGTYRWYPPSPDISLMLLWLAQTIHPEVFSDINFENALRDHYQDFFGFDLQDEHIFMIMNPIPEASVDR